MLSQSPDGLETCFEMSRSRLRYKVKCLGLGHEGLVYSEHFAKILKFFAKFASFPQAVL